jgi:hypothetical protein
MFDAASWLDAWLEAYPWQKSDFSAGKVLVRDALELPKDTRIALHKETVARLPILRDSSDDPYAWHKGSAVYELAVCLYGKKLPYNEDDVVALLTSSTHRCGHGADVKPPFEMAVTWARTYGVTRAWLAAVRAFIDGLRGLRSVQANDLKTKGSLVLLLDNERKETSRCASERFRADLALLPPDERAAWERLVLHMGTAMGARIPKGYDVQASALATFVGVERVIARLEHWLPRPNSPCRLETAGSHLLRNLVWLLLAMSRDAAAAPSCDELVERLIRVDVIPAQLGKKVALAGAVYFAQRPHAVGRRPLESLLARTKAMEKGSYDSDGIQKIVGEYLSRTT